MAVQVAVRGKSNDCNTASTATADVESVVVRVSVSADLDDIQVGSSCTAHIHSDGVHKRALGKRLDLDWHGG